MAPRSKTGASGEQTPRRARRKHLADQALSADAIRAAAWELLRVASMWERSTPFPDEIQVHQERLLRKVLDAVAQHWQTTPVGKQLVGKNPDGTKKWAIARLEDAIWPDIHRAAQQVLDKYCERAGSVRSDSLKSKAKSEAIESLFREMACRGFPGLTQARVEEAWASCAKAMTADWVSKSKKTTSAALLIQAAGGPSTRQLGYLKVIFARLVPGQPDLPGHRLHAAIEKELLTQYFSSAPHKIQEYGLRAMGLGDELVAALMVQIQAERNREKPLDVISALVKSMTFLAERAQLANGFANAETQKATPSGPSPPGRKR